MKKITLFSLMICTIFIACSDDQNAIETVTVETERGAVLRTVSIQNGEFQIDNIESLYSIEIEEQDIQDGDLLSSVDVYLSFIDNTIETTDISTPKILFKTYAIDDFTIGGNGLPIMSVDYTFNELLEATSIDHSSVACKDQFRIDLDLHLTDGRVFNIRNSAGTVVNNSGFFKSPFTYLINIVEPIPNDSFVGVYQMEQIQDGFFGNSFIDENRIVEIFRGHSNNVRFFQFIDGGGGTFSIEFSIVCDTGVITRYQKNQTASCNSHDPTDRVLIGPDNPPGIADSNDDTVFELWYLEGFEGFNTGCDFRDFPAKIRFSKQ